MFSFATEDYATPTITHREDGQAVAVLTVQSLSNVAGSGTYSSNIGPVIVHHHNGNVTFTAESLTFTLPYERYLQEYNRAVLLTRIQRLSPEAKTDLQQYLSASADFFINNISFHPTRNGYYLVSDGVHSQGIKSQHLL